VRKLSWLPVVLALVATWAPSLAAAESLAPGAPRVLVVNQYSPHYPTMSDRRGRQVEMLLRHFTPYTVRISEAEYLPATLADFTHVVVVGNDAETPLPEALLDDLAEADQTILWIGYGLDQLPVDFEAQFGFAPGDYAGDDMPERVVYREASYAARVDDYVEVAVSSPVVRVLSTYLVAGSTIPYVVQGENLWFVNGLPNLDSDHPDPEEDAPTLILADVLHDFFQTGIEPQRKAVIRLEDVSVHIDAAQLAESVDFLYGQRVPFALGLIPAQRLEDGRVLRLAERPAFVRALRDAQDRGATIVLHGYHHTFGSGEDFEFWDDERKAPLAGETWGMYAAKVEDGIRILRDLGLEPRLWETPHYAASPLAYRVFSHYFSHAIENREPASWLPYPAGPDEFGQYLIPESIGYINPTEGATAEQQLERARLLAIVRDAWAVGFYHPANVPLSELKALVSGLRRQGYSFVDLRALPTEVRADYRPDPRTRLKTWLAIDLELNQEQLERRLNWWAAIRQVPWGAVLVVGMGLVFLLRLREQWRPAPVAARTLVESAQGSKRWLPRPLPAVALVAVGSLVLVSAAWAFSSPRRGGSSSSLIAGWSDLAWSIEYEGYGKVGIEDGALSLEPLPAREPRETRAALALAGSPDWRDYSFSVRMSTQEQLRQNSPPNAWETGWLFFRYQGEDRAYYLAHKTNGLELGKVVPPAGTGQIFLVTSQSPPAEMGRWYEFRIDVRGPVIQVYVDGKLQLSYTDPDPILSGRVGLYTEDAHVHFSQPSVTTIGPER
jgi:hypothetical protein